MVGAKRTFFENMESLARSLEMAFSRVFYTVYTQFSFGSFYLDRQNHIVEYPRVQGCM
jgi:hypothetical protein